MNIIVAGHTQLRAAVPELIVRPNDEATMKALNFSEPRNGWIEITFVAGEGHHTVIASAVPNDCIRDFVQATTRILSGSTAELVQFSLEPDYATCHLQGNGRDIRVSVVEPGDDNTVFEAVFPTVPFAKRLAFECKRLQPLYGKAESWRWEYPAREVECLAAAARDAEPDGPTNRSQPVGTDTNQPSAAAGSGR